MTSTAAAATRPGDDLVRRAVTAQRVDGDADAHRLTARESASGSTSRPLVRLAGRARMVRRFGEPHCGHRLTRGASMPCCARRLSRRDFEVFRLGTAMSGRSSYRNRLVEQKSVELPLPLRPVIAIRSPEANSRVDRPRGAPRKPPRPSGARGRGKERERRSQSVIGRRASAAGNAGTTAAQIASRSPSARGRMSRPRSSSSGTQIGSCVPLRSRSRSVSKAWSGQLPVPKLPPTIHAS